jgi:hypothetical protein|tara:strand:- start:676 stop:936 length:261 start_codon:yes stop_codon:yes gene_type:complete
MSLTSKDGQPFAAVKDIVEESYVYIPDNCEAMRIITSIYEETDLAESHFLAEGEESGDQYQIYFSEVNLANDFFYKLTLANWKDRG